MFLFLFTDAMTVVGFLKHFGLDKDFKVDINSIVSYIHHIVIRLSNCHTLVKLSLPCAVESHPTPGDSRGSSSPSRSLSGVSFHVADGGSARIPLESVHPSLPWSSSLSRSIHSPEITLSSIPPALTTCPK